MTPQTDTTAKLFSFLHRGGAFAHWWTPDSGKFFTSKKSGQQEQAKISLWYPVDRPLPVPAAWSDKNVYFCVHPQTSVPQKLRADGGVADQKYVKAWVSHVAAVNCFFGEYDVKDFGSKDAIAKHLHTLPLYPSVVIDSGGGFHCYWLLASTVMVTDDNRDHIKRVQYAWVDFVGSDSDAKDLARVLRVPGTLNRKEKYAPHYPRVTVIEADYGRLYSLEEFERLTEHLRQERPRSSYTGSHSVTDDLVTAAENLRRLSPGRRDHYQEWVKVGMALKNLGSAGLQLWDEWSRGSAKYTDGCCDAKWDKISTDGLGLGSLIKWANDDDPAGKRSHTNGHVVYTNGHSAPSVSVQEPVHDLKAKPQSLENILLNAGINDEGNADCVLALHGKTFLYSETLGWLHYDGCKWTAETAEAKVDRAIVKTLEERVKAALQTGNMEAYSTLIKFCIPNKGKVQGCKYMLQSKVSVSHEEFDRDPDLLNCKNGIVNLRTGKLTPHDYNQRFTYCVTVDYIPDADHTMWDEWLIDGLGGSFEAYKYIQIAVGYSLTGHTSEEILFYLYGPPRSGKGTFTETWLAILGVPLAKEVDFGTFTAKRTGDSQNFDLAPLRPCRFVAASESNAYERFNEAKVKALTGGNEVYCAFKHRDHFSYRPQFKIWLSSNQPVNADPDDDAVWGRVRVLTFPNSHLGDEDKSLKHNMKTEKAMQGALAWGVKGAMEWYRLGQKGMPEIAESKEIKETHRNDLDSTQTFIDECCLVGDTYFVAQDRLFPNYENWCIQNGVEPKKKKGLTQSLKKKGFNDDRRTINGIQKRGIVGIGLRDERI